MIYVNLHFKGCDLVVKLHCLCKYPLVYAKLNLNYPGCDN